MIAIYSRKSIYSDKSDSTANQFSMCQDYIRVKKLVGDVRLYEDEGFSGGTTKRPQFEKLIKDITDKKITHVLCYKIDRISRNVRDFSNFFSLCEDYQVSFISVSEQIDTSTPLGRAMMYVSSVFAQMERETISERVRDNMTEMSKLGVWCGGPAPLGYRRVKTIINGKNHTILEIDEEGAETVRAIFKEFETTSLSQMERRRKGQRSPTGARYHMNSFAKALRSPFCVQNTPEVWEYYNSLGCQMCPKEDFDGTKAVCIYGRTQQRKGKKHTNTTPDKWIVAAALHDYIIPADEWLAAQRRFGQNVCYKPRIHDVGVLAPILYCKCGCKMRIASKNLGSKYSYSYKCNNRDRWGSCDMSQIKIDKIDSLVIDTIKSIAIDTSQITQPKSNKTAIKKKISAKEREIYNLTKSLGRGRADKYILPEIDRLDREIAELEAQMREESIDKFPTLEELEQLLQGYEELELSEKRLIIQSIISKAVWDGEKLTLTYL